MLQWCVCFGSHACIQCSAIMSPSTACMQKAHLPCSGQLSYLQLVLSSYRIALEVHRSGTWQHLIAEVRGAAARQQLAAVQSREA